MTGTVTNAGWDPAWGRPQVVIDWDGTLVAPSWPERTTEWMPGAVSAVKALVEAGVRVIVMSSRIAPFEPGEKVARAPEMVDAEIAYIRTMLDTEGLQEVDIQDLRKWPWKPGAVAYVDDKGVFYDGQPETWARLVPQLLVAAGVHQLA